MLTKQQVIERLCKLSTKVGEEVFCNQKAHDCFCGENKTSEVFSGGFQFEEEVIEFIEEAVREKMDKEFYLNDF